VLEAVRASLNLGQHCLGLLDSAGIGHLIVQRRPEKDVQGLEQVRAAEPRQVGLIVAAAGVVIGPGRPDFDFEQRPDARFLLGFPPSIL
jgi:hypothetical protein